MKNKKILAIILAFIILTISILSIFSYAEDIEFNDETDSSNPGTNNSMPSNTNNGNNNGSNSELPKPGDWHAPSPHFHKFKLDTSTQPPILNIHLKTTVNELLKDITITLAYDNSGKEWSLLDLEPTKVLNGKTYTAMEEKVFETLPTFAGYTEDDFFGIAIINNKGQLLKDNDYIGTGTKIQFRTEVLGGEWNVSSIQKVASVNQFKLDVGNNFKIAENDSTSQNNSNDTTCIIKGDITGDGMSNIYDITGLISEIYDKPEDHEWDFAVKKAAILTKEDKETPDIYDIQQLIKDNFDK